MKIKRAIKVVAVLFFITTWLLMCGENVYLLLKNSAEYTFGPLDVVRRVTAPDGKKTAILVRSYGSFIDLNFALYVSDDRMVDVTDSTTNAAFITDAKLSNMSDAAIWIKRALWISRDYEPTTSRNWREDLIWSVDGLVIVVTVEENYVFAHDFGTGQRYEDSERIAELLELHNK